MKEVLRVKNLVSKYHKNLDWSLAENEIHGIVGPSGQGKSYFLKILLDLLPYYSGKITAGDGKPWNYMEQKVGMQFQSNGLINIMTIGENIMMPLIVKLNMPEKFAAIVALHYMHVVGLGKEVFDLFPSECSGGMQKRSALAVSLVLEPKILFLDEPTAGLDTLVLENYDQLLLKLAKEHKMTILMVTHDLSRLAKIADRISVLISGKMVTGKFDELLKSNNLMVKEFLESYVRTTATF